MTQEREARKLANEYWSLLRRKQFGVRPEVFLLGTLLDRRHAKEYENWIKKPIPAIYRAPFLKRMHWGKLNRAWMTKYFDDITVLSLGQNCLPWLLPNRWGLRPKELDISPIGPFDLFATIGDKISEAVEGDFEPFLRESALKQFAGLLKTPTLMNEAMQASFFHEMGNWWAADNWRRLRVSYQERIDRFKRIAETGSVLYVYCICGKNNVDALIKTYLSKLHRDNCRLLIINVLSEPVLSGTKYEQLNIVNIPYPQDYNWTYWNDYTSERGVAFEFAIAEAIKAELQRLRPPPEPVGKWFATLRKRMDVSR